MGNFDVIHNLWRYNQDEVHNEQLIVDIFIKPNFNGNSQLINNVFRTACSFKLF